MEKKEQHRLACPIGRRLLAGLALSLCVTVVVLGVGCNQVQRHRVLTFFFEGVPPVDKAFRPSASIVVTNTGILPARTAAGRFDTPAAAQRRGSRHPPAPDCTRCHASSFQQYERELLAPLPQLCYICHDSYDAPALRLHGPVALGECVVCHNPHQSGYVHLQVAAQPDLCYRCHDTQDMAAIPGHDKMEKTICTDCHDPHASEHEKLLRFVETSQPDPNTIG